jgi:hypothetical protein
MSSFVFSYDYGILRTWFAIFFAQEKRDLIGNRGQLSQESVGSWAF